MLVLTVIWCLFPTALHPFLCLRVSFHEIDKNMLDFLLVRVAIVVRLVMVGLSLSSHQDSCCSFIN